MAAATAPAAAAAAEGCTSFRSPNHLVAAIQRMQPAVGLRADVQSSGKSSIRGKLVTKVRGSALGSLSWRNGRGLVLFRAAARAERSSPEPKFD